MYEIPVYKISMIRDGIQKASVNKIGSPDDVYELVSTYLQGADREHFVVLLLGTKNQVLGVNTVSIGTLNASLVHPREVFKPAICLNAHSIILAHNHPSGDPTPSKEDLAITERLKEAGDLLNIKVLDHVIIGDDCFRSLKASIIL